MDKLSLISVCINPDGPDRPGGHKSGEYALFRREGSVKGFVIEQAVHRGQGHAAPTHFKTWFVVETEPPAQAKELLVKIGHGSPYMDGQRYVCFTKRDLWELNNTGEKLRVKNAQGTVVGEYTIPADRCDVLPTAPKAPVDITRPAAGVAGVFGIPR